MTDTSIVWRLLPVVVISTLAAYLMRSVFYKSSVDLEKLELRIFFQITGTYNFISSIIPFGLGHLSYPLLLKKHYGVAMSRSVSSLIFYNAIRMSILCFLFIYSGVALNIFRFLSLPVVETLAVIFVASVALYLFIKFSGIGNIVIVGKYREIRKSIVRDLKKNIRSGHAIKLFLFSTGVVAFNIVSIFYIYRLIGQSLPITAILFLFSAGNISRLLPIHGPGSFGSTEAINSAILMGMEYSMDDAIRLSIMAHLSLLFIQGSIAIPCYVLIRLDARKNNFSNVG